MCSNGFKDKDDLTDEAVKAYASGTLITPKHDPYCLGVIMDPRTVLSYELRDNHKIRKMLENGEFRMRKYKDSRPRHSPHYYVIEPVITLDGCPASGVLANSSVGNTQRDRIVAVNSHKKGLHIWGENNSQIEEWVLDGSLDYLGEL